jgi:uncharacterized protein (TIGR03067 family)
MSRATIALAPALLLLLIAPASYSDDAKTEIDKFQGTWAVVSYEENGQKLPEEEVKKVRFVFDQDRYEVKRGDDVEEVGTIKLDTSKNPKRIDLKIQKAPIGEGETQLGVYQLDGDSLKICVSVPPGSKDRPSAFEKAGTNELLIVLKRKKA